MKKEIYFFDLDGTLWDLKSSIFIIDKEKPYKPIIKIDPIDFTLISKGYYKKDNIPLDYNGQKFFISKALYDKIYKRTGFENIGRFGVSFMGQVDKKQLDKTPINFLLNNIEHLRGKPVEVGILTARSNQKNHSDIINDLRLKLKDMNVPLTKVYFVGDQFKSSHLNKDSIKKVYVLLEHLIGFKIKDNQFVPLKQDWFDTVHFYDDNIGNISFANDCQKILNDLLKKTDDDLFRIIIERITSGDLTLFTYMITNNELNRFKEERIILKEPDKFPIKENRLIRFEKFESLEPFDFQEDWEEDMPKVKKSKTYKQQREENKKYLRSIGIRPGEDTKFKPEFRVGDRVVCKILLENDYVDRVGYVVDVGDSSCLVYLDDETPHILHPYGNPPRQIDNTRVRNIPAGHGMMVSFQNIKRKKF